MTTTIGLSAVLALGMAGGPPFDDVAWAQPPDDHDPHLRPPQYMDPELKVPPASHLDPQYPLAVAFTPADASNYTPGGMVSYDYVVVHTMQGYYAGAISWFQNPSANVSAHYVMRAEDGEVTQMVMHEDRAWHVGTSNPYAIGIEHEGFVDDPSWYTWQTYLSSARLARWLCDHYEIPIDRDHIVGHVELPNQTHTDPGQHWNWDLYMALVLDQVSAGDVQGVVVDSSAACTIVATQDTWLKATMEQSVDLAEADKCSVPAGTELTYWHASDPMYGHRRLVMPDDGPCEGWGELGQQAFIAEGHWEGMCAPEELGAAGVELALDGGAGLLTDDAGRFHLGGVTPGAHVIDVIDSPAYQGTSVPFDLEVYPGERLVIVVDPAIDEEPGGTTTGSLPGSTGGDDPSDSGTAGVLPDDDGFETEGGTSGATEGLPLPPRSTTEESGCGCRSTGGGAAWGWLSLLVLFTSRRYGLRCR